MASIPNLLPDQVFAQRYRVVRLLKAGGMGAVYEVRHTATDKRGTRSDPTVTVAALMSGDSATSLLARLCNDAQRAAS